MKKKKPKIPIPQGKTIKQLIEEDPTSPPPSDDEEHEAHPLNLTMKFNSSRKGRKTDKEKKEFQNQLSLKVKYEKVYLYWD